MLDFIAFPIGRFLKFIYEAIAFQNYGLAIIVLTVIIKSVLLPLYVKQYKSMSKMSEFQPKIQEIQSKYKNDKAKINEETMKLYQAEKINPAGGCLPLLIQMPILFSLYYVISQPLKYMVGKSPEVIAKLFEAIPVGADRIASMLDLSIINYFSKHTDKLSEVSNLLTRDEVLNMNFLGMNLGAVPTMSFRHMNGENFVLFLIPILAVITTYISTKVSTPQPQKGAKGSENKMQDSMQKNMLIMAPLMTGFISFTVPAGMGLYWIISNIFQIVQQMFMNKFIIKKKVEVKAEKLG